MGKDEAGILAQLKKLRAELLDSKVDEFRGPIVKTTGDGFLVEFPSAVCAVQNAVDVQYELVQRNMDIPEDRRAKMAFCGVIYETLTY